MGIARGSGLRIYYELVGTGQPLILLHGSMGSTESWRTTGYTEALADAFQLVLVDLRGHGRSDRPTGAKAYLTTTQVADVLAVLDDLELESAALLGWSRGGDIALAAAAFHPERVEALVIIGTSADTAGFGDVAPPPVKLARSMAARLSKQGMTAVEAELIEQGRPEWAHALRRADPKAMASLWRSLTLIKPSDMRLGDLTQPILAIWGEHEKPDPMPPLPDQAQVSVLPGEEHFGAFSRSVLIVPEVRAFLAVP
jgi:pimeloyl-ACP methyl ester carboxylesterase